MVFLLLLCLSQEGSANDVERICADVRTFHGGAGPWAVAGYRIGQDALEHFQLERGSGRLKIVHYAPAEVQFSCMVDGLQAATGASLGKLNLQLVKARETELRTEITDRQTGRCLVYSLKPEFRASILNLPMSELASAGRRVAGLSSAKIFEVETKLP